MAEHVADNRPKKKPGWMSIPGGPKEPNLTEFRAKLQAKSAEKTKCFDRLNEIRDMFQTKPDDVDRNLARSEQQKLRDRMREIETERRKERDGRNAKDAELKGVRSQRRALEDQLKELLGDLKGLKTLEDIEEAIDRVMYKLETSSGDLATEKKTVKRLNQLEEAKALVLQLQPLQEGVSEAEEKELALQAEFKEIHERIATLNKQYEEQAKVKEAKDKEVKKTPGPDRAAVQKERDDIRAKIATINNDMDEIRKKFDASREEWNKWREVAMEKYRKQVEDERAERAARFAERDKQRKQERKLARALKKLNPYENEIDACTSLIRYLEDKTTVTKRNLEEVVKKKKVAAFDPKTFCPDGAHLAHAEEEESWVFGDRTKKQQKQPAKPAKKEEKPADDKKAPAKDRYLQHTVDKFRSFELVKVETPMTMAQVPAALEELKKKKKEYESHKKTKEQILEEATSSDEEAEEGEGEAQE